MKNPKLDWHHEISLDEMNGLLINDICTIGQYEEVGLIRKVKKGKTFYVDKALFELAVIRKIRTIVWWEELRDPLITKDNEGVSIMENLDYGDAGFVLTEAVKLRVDPRPWEKSYRIKVKD
jgi:hypothetical protein